MKLPMHHRRLLASFLGILALSGIAAADSAPRSSLVTLETGSIATVVMPDDSQTLQGLVVLIHGWSGSRDEVGNLFKRQAALLAKQGIASLRMGIRGESERAASGYRLTSTFLTRVADAKAGVDWLQAQHPNLPLGLLGFSYGGATALELISQSPTRYDSVVLWSTTVNPNDIFANTGRASALRQAISTGEGEFEDWTTLTITREHILGMIGFDPLRGLSAYQGALLSLHGAEDYLPLYGPTIIERTGGERAEYHVLKGADHIFNVFDEGKTYGDRVLELSLEWLVSTLNPQ